MSESSERLPAFLSELIVSREDFDASFNAGDYPVVDARGCSTMGIARFLQDVHGTNMDEEQFFEEIPTVQEITGVWLMRRSKLVHTPESAALIKLNRVFGIPGAQKDLLLSEYAEEVRTLTLLGHRLPDIERIEYGSPGNSEQALMRLLGESGTKGLLERSSSRRGVQVIYGGEGFEKYINEYSEPDDNHKMARRLENRRIPNEYVRAIIPLGEYERDKLE